MEYVLLCTILCTEYMYVSMYFMYRDTAPLPTRLGNVSVARIHKLASRGYDHLRCQHTRAVLTKEEYILLLIPIQPSTNLYIQCYKGQYLSRSQCRHGVCGEVEVGRQ